MCNARHSSKHAARGSLCNPLHNLVLAACRLSLLCREGMEPQRGEATAHGHSASGTDPALPPVPLSTWALCTKGHGNFGFIIVIIFELCEQFIYFTPQ